MIYKLFGTQSARLLTFYYFVCQLSIDYATLFCIFLKKNVEGIMEV